MPASASDPRPAQRVWVHAAAVALAALVAALWSLGPWSAWADRAFFDAYTVASAPGGSDLPVVLVAIDEPSFQELRTAWPFPRRMHAALIERLREDGALGVAFDVVFAEPSHPADDEALREAIARWPRVVLAATRERLDTAQTTLWTEVPPLASLREAGAQAGQAGVWPDDDFVVRRTPPGEDTLSARLAALARQAAPQAFAPEAPPAPWLRYAGPRGSFDTRSYYQAVGPGLLPPGFFQGKLVLVGRAVRTGTEISGAQADMFNSPFAWADGSDRLIPGVELHAHLLANRLLGQGQHPPSLPWPWIAGLLAATAIAALGQRVHPGTLAAATAGLVLLAVLASGWAFAQVSVWASPVPVLALALAAYAASALVGYVGARRRAREIRQMFAQYVPPEVVAELVAHPERFRLGGETRELTVMFTDLAGFTDLSERLRPEDTVAVLTEYFDTMTAIVHHHRGTVDKFIGDAVMAFWGAPLPTPEHARLALAAAREMQAAVAALSQRLQARGLPALRMRIGLHSGPAVVGNIGSASRFSYTAVGDTVNLAARLEGANKAFGSGLMVSQATLDAAGPQTGDDMRALADVVVKGKTQAVRVYTPDTDATLRERARALLDACASGDAQALAAPLADLLAHAPGDAAAGLMRQRWGRDLAWGAPLPLDKL